MTPADRERAGGHHGDSMPHQVASESLNDPLVLTS